MKRERIKGWILILTFAVATGVSAQKVITNHTSASGYPVIDVSELARLGCVWTRAEAAVRRTERNAQTVSANAFVSPAGKDASGENGNWNAKMSPLFQVMRADLNAAQPWVTAYDACRTYSGEGGAAGQWRLPTQKELQKIYALQSQLAGKGGFTAFDAGTYWSCTESNPNYAWFVSFYDGFTSSYDKTGTSRVRCVRDL